MFDIDSEGATASVLLERALVARPGADVLAVLSGIEPHALSSGERVDLVRALERQISWAVALQQRALAAMAQAPEGVEDWTSVEVAAALRLSSGTAERRLAVARALEQRLPATWHALAAGEIGYYHAAAVAEATLPLDEAGATAVEERVIDRAPDQTLAELRRSLRRAVIVADPALAEQMHSQARAERRVERWLLDHGMAALHAEMPAEDTATVMAALDAIASRAEPGDERTMPARRADALVALADNYLASPDLPLTHGARPHITLTVSLDTVLGRSEEPGELDGYGPLTAQVARRLAHDGRWPPRITGPRDRPRDRPGDGPGDGHSDGPGVESGRRRHRPEAALRDEVITRDVTCRAPGCSTPASRTEIDHAIPFDQGGPTTAGNLGLLCKRHHRWKHLTGATVTYHPDGSATWTTPTGRTYHVPPYRDTS